MMFQIFDGKRGKMNRKNRCKCFKYIKLKRNLQDPGGKFTEVVQLIKRNTNLTCIKLPQDG